MRKLMGVAAAMTLLGFAGEANAAVVFPVTASNGWASANVTQSGTTLTIALTELLANPTEAQMLSGFELLFDTAPVTVTTLTEAGPLVNIAANGVYTNIAGSPTHWGDGLSGNAFILETVGPFAVGGQPFDLITDGTSDTSANNGTVNFDPYIDGTGTFTVQLPTGYDALSHITGGAFQFSTAAGFTTGFMTGVPEPSTWALMLIGLFGAGWAHRRSRKVGASLVTA